MASTRAAIRADCLVGVWSGLGAAMAFGLRVEAGAAGLAGEAGLVFLDGLRPRLRLRLVLGLAALAETCFLTSLAFKV